MKRAFTLIELLVVIAIIAILAAILFPVFSQAKEAAKKTQTLSNYKQTATAAQMYLSDTDDAFPLSAGFNTAANQWRTYYLMGVPTGWTTSAARNVEPRFSEESVFVLNAMQPYMKSTGLYEAAGLPIYDYGAAQAAGMPKPQPVNISYNGLLHAYSGTGIASPAQCPMFWGGLYKQNIKGFAITSPNLDCGVLATPNCRFNPTQGAQGGAAAYGYIWWGLGSSSSVWLYARSTPFIYSDTHAKMVSLNGPIVPLYAENVNVNPFSSFSDAKGTPYWMTDCVNPGGTKGTTYYPGYFRPDSEYNYTNRECDFLVG